MIERRGGSRLPFKSPDLSLVLCEVCGQEFQRNLAIEPPIEREIDFTHPACAQQGTEFVLSNPLSHCKTRLPARHAAGRPGAHRRGFIVSLALNGSNCALKRGRFNEVAGFFKGCDKALCIRFQGIVPRARFVEKGRPMVGGVFECSLEYGFQLVPPFGIHI
jgi:hypothetical protein